MRLMWFGHVNRMQEICLIQQKVGNVGVPEKRKIDGGETDLLGDKEWIHLPISKGTGAYRSKCKVLIKNKTGRVWMTIGIDKSLITNSEYCNEKGHQLYHITSPVYKFCNHRFTCKFFYLSWIDNKWLKL